MSDDEFLMQFFAYRHLPENLQVISRPFGELAATIMMLPPNQQRTVALGRLLEAKDAAVRCALAG